MQAFIHTEGDMYVLVLLYLITDHANHCLYLEKFPFKLFVVCKERLCFLCELLLVIVHFRVFGDLQLLPQVVSDCLKEYKAVSVNEVFQLRLILWGSQLGELAPQGKDQ